MAATDVLPLPPSTHYAPEPRARRRRVRLLAVAALAVSVAYLTWRVTQTLDWSVWWLSVPMLLLEVHAVVGLALFTFSLWDLDGVVPAGPVSTTTDRVAVLIPTYNEPEEILLPTIAAAVALEPRHETWVLDDGDRPEIRALAESLGASYSARRDRKDAKAGNLNQALTHIDADFVAVLDADHVATPDFLRHTLGYFAAPDVALVQTPQEFYNGESFEHVQPRTRGLTRQERQVYSEQALFYRAIQPGKNRFKGAFWCGTGAVIRVAALREVGGVATGSVTEDIQTTIRLQRRGWRSVYHNEVLARGLAAATVDQYALQRHRWCTGAMQVLRHERPLTGPGLTLAQRVAYAATLLGWFDAWRTLGYLLLPLVVVLTGVSPIRALWPAFLTWFSVTFGLQQLALWRLGRGYSHPLPTVIFELVRMTPTLQATTALIRRRVPEFRVTPKGRLEDDRGRAPAPRVLVALLGLSLLSMGWYAATLAGLTPLTYGTPPVAHGAFFWLVLNAVIITGAIRRVRAERYAGERRASVRFPVHRPVMLGHHPCELLDVSLTGARVVLPADAGLVPGGARYDLHLELHDGAVRYPCTVRGHWLLPGGDVRVGLEFADVAPHERARLALWAFGLSDHPDPLPAQPVEQARVPASVGAA